MVLLRFGWSCLSGLISSCVKSFCKKKKKNSCLFSDFRLIFVFIFLFHFIFFCSSWYLTENKIYTNQFDQVRLLFLLTLLFLLDFLMLHIHILLSFYSRHIFESIIFNIEDNVWFKFGGMYIDFYLFVLFCFVVLKKKKFKKILLPSLRFMFWVCYTTLA